MTGEPINLTALRATLNSEVYSGSSLYPDQASRMPTWIRTDDVLALIDAVEAAHAVGEAHRAVIEGVTPKHPHWCATDQDEYRGRFSRWHATTRTLREALERFTP